MVEEFDKEIDAILRKARENQAVFAANVSEPHLDADTLSAFAENALPEKSKKLYTAHLADCDRCRRILSNLISLNAEEEIVPVKSAETPSVETAIPWYRKLFFGQNLVYTMGALVVMFGAFTGFIIFQNNAGKNSEVSQISADKSATKGGPSADQEPFFSSNSAATAPSNATAASNTAVMQTNTASNTAISAMNTSSAVSPTANTSTTPILKEAPKGRLSDDGLITGGEQAPTANESVRKDRDNNLDKAENKTALSETQPKTDAAEPRKPKVAAAAPAPPKPSADEKEVAEDDKALTTRSANPYGASGTSKAKKLEERKRAGGKTFRYENSVWIDSEYRQGMPITNVSRGSSEYKKLDGGLRNIAEQFNGTVVVVWKSKAYQIR